MAVASKGRSLFQGQLWLPGHLGGVAVDGVNFTCLDVFLWEDAFAKWKRGLAG
jgi:hypothetical protein